MFLPISSSSISCMSHIINALCVCAECARTVGAAEYKYLQSVFTFYLPGALILAAAVLLYMRWTIWKFHIWSTSTHIGTHSGSNLFNHLFIGEWGAGVWEKRSAFCRWEHFFNVFSFLVCVSCVCVCLLSSVYLSASSLSSSLLLFFFSFVFTVPLRVKLFLATNIPNVNCILVSMCSVHVMCIWSFRRFSLKCRRRA